MWKNENSFCFRSARIHPWINKEESKFKIAILKSHFCNSASEYQSLYLLLGTFHIFLGMLVSQKDIKMLLSISPTIMEKRGRHRENTWEVTRLTTLLSHHWHSKQHSLETEEEGQFSGSIRATAPIHPTLTRSFPKFWSNHYDHFMAQNMDFSDVCSIKTNISWRIFWKRKLNKLS